MAENFPCGYLSSPYYFITITRSGRDIYAMLDCLEVLACRFRKCRTERGGFLFSFYSPCSPGKFQDPIIRVSSIVMQITITNRRRGRDPLRYRGTEIFSFSPSPFSSALPSSSSRYLSRSLPETGGPTNSPWSLLGRRFRIGQPSKKEGGRQVETKS